MTIHRPRFVAFDLAALVVGQAALLWGLVVGLAYWLAFAVLLPQGGPSVGPMNALPMGPPLVGLVLGVAGLMLARGGPRGLGALAGAGLALSGLALALALGMGAWA